MKYSIKKMFGTAMFLCLTVLFMSSCYENHYYSHYHHHTRGWYDNHHMPPPAGVDFNVDVRR
jgi:hypothetical protein